MEYLNVFDLVAQRIYSVNQYSVTADPTIKPKCVLKDTLCACVRALGLGYLCV